MLRRRLFLISAASAATLTLSGCLSSVGGGVIGADLGGGEAVSEKTLLANQKALKAEVKAFISSLSVAQINLAQALGLKTQAAELRQSAKAFATGVVSSESLDKTSTVSQQANAAIEEAMKKAEAFTEKQKKKVSESLDKYASAAVSTMRVGGIAGKSASQLTSTIASGKVTDVEKLKQQMSFTVDAASNIPPFASDLVKMGWNYIELAKERGVDTTKAAETLKSAV